MPNVRCTFSRPSFSLRFTAVRNVRKGEQLFYSYTSPTASAHDRQKSLAPYGIVFMQCLRLCHSRVRSSSPRGRSAYQTLLQAERGIDASSWKFVPRKSLTCVFVLKQAIQKEGLETEVDFILLWLSSTGFA